MEKFETMTYEQFAEVDGYFRKRSGENCEGQAVCAYLWKNYYHTQIARNEDCLYLLQSYHKAHSAWPPMCTFAELPDAIIRMQRYFREELKETFVMYCIDGKMKECLSEEWLKRQNLQLLPTPDFDDYIYDAEKMRTLSGRKLHKKKNHVNAFLKQYQKRQEYRTLTVADTPEVMACLKAWREQRERMDAEDTLEYEQEGILEVMQHMNQLAVHAGGIYIDGEMKAFSLGSYNEEQQMAYVHVEKADARIRGLYPYMSQQFICHEYPQAQYVNREDDMGMPGLRKAKESFCPVRKGHKYMLKEKIF